MLRNNCWHPNSENNLNNLWSNFKTHFFKGEKRPMIIFSCGGVVRKGGIFLRRGENFQSFNEHTVTSGELARSMPHGKSVSTHQLFLTGFCWMPRINTPKAGQDKRNEINLSKAFLAFPNVQCNGPSKADGRQTSYEKFL